MNTKASHKRAGRIRRRMASGIVALIPLVVTIAILRFLFDLTSSIFLPVVGPIVEGWPPAASAALSFGVLLVAVYLLGEVATNFVGRRALGLGESLVLRVPLVKVVYSAAKQVVAAFERREGRAFKSVVLVPFPTPGLRALGFVTGSVADPAGAKWTTVFIPTTPNPTTGYLQLFPEADLVQTGYTIEQGIKMVMSLGVVTPDGEPIPG